MSDPAKPEAVLSFPKPSINDDVAFLYEGFDHHELLFQECSTCNTRRFPPTPMCPNCGSLDWSAQKSEGLGSVHSYTVQHHPPIVPYPTPHALLLVDMDEGFRFLAAYAGEMKAISIGMRVSMKFVQLDDELTLPVFEAIANGEGSAR